VDGVKEEKKIPQRKHCPFLFSFFPLRFTPFPAARHLMEDQQHSFFEAVKSNDVPKAAQILAGNPELDINWKNARGQTPLQYSCAKDLVNITEWLLAQRKINVAVVNTSGASVFMIACGVLNSGCAKVLIEDRRIDLNKPNNSGTTPLVLAITRGNIELIKWWIASGREIDLGDPWTPSDSAEAVRGSGNAEIFVLLERYREDPVKTRRQVRSELGVHEEKAAEAPAPVVFLSNGLPSLPQNNIPGAKPLRFFRIMAQLPLELQMLISNVTVGPTNISSRSSEKAVRYLAMKLVIWE
jgi:hypothetical protein